MESIDKNDVDIKRLFNWGKEFIIKDDNNQELLKVYLRIIGDEDLNRVKVYALRESNKLRKKLKDLDSDERIAYLPDPSTVQKEALVEVSLMSSMRRFAKDATENAKMQLPTEPRSDATLEQHEKYQEVVDEWPDTRSNRIEEELRKIIQKETERLNSLSKEELFSFYESALISELCEMQMLDSYSEMSAYLSSFSDPEFKNKMFESLEEFKNLPKAIKDQIEKGYQSLDIKVDDLKKLRGATQ